MIPQEEFDALNKRAARTAGKVAELMIRVAGLEKKFGLADANDTEPPVPETPQGSRAHDTVDRPAHYTQHPAGIECIQVVEHLGFNVGNAIKYLWRQGLKNDRLEDLRKAAWYINREILRVEKQPSVGLYGGGGTGGHIFTQTGDTK